MIEFVKGEEFCRWNGVLMNVENHRKLFGVDYEIFVEDGYIDDGDTIYTDEPIGKILYKLGTKYDKPEPYDPVLNLNSVSAIHDHAWEEKLAGQIVFDADFIENLVVKPMSQFKKDHPKFNQKLHDEFYEELDAYYDNKKFN